MQNKLFYSKIDAKKTTLQTSIEWQSNLLTPLLEAQLVQIHVASFLDLYQH